MYGIASQQVSSLHHQAGLINLSLSLCASKILIVMAQRLKYIGLHISSYLTSCHTRPHLFFSSKLVKSEFWNHHRIVPCPPRPLQWVHQSSCQEVRHKDPRPVGVSDSETDSFGKPTHPASREPGLASSIRWQGRNQIISNQFILEIFSPWGRIKL